jgi:hypothetical protein
MASKERSFGAARHPRPRVSACGVAGVLLAPVSERNVMNDIAYVTIPADHVEAVTEAVLGLYGARAEALGATALAFLDGSDDLAELEHARGELRAIEDALADLGWPRADRAGPVEVVGPPRVLRELIRAALLDAANAVVAVVSRYEAGREELPAVRRAVDAVPVLYGVFARLEAEHVAVCD